MSSSYNCWASILAQQPFLPVLSQLKPSQVEDLVASLAKAGFTYLEFTLRSPEAWQLLSQVNNACKTHNLQLIAGSISQIEHLTELEKHRIDLAVSPGWFADLAKTAKSKKINLLPGIATPGEAMQAAALGFQQVKFFPAASLGKGYLTALSAAVPSLSFVPTGGINATNFNEWLTTPKVIGLGASWLFTSPEYKQGSWQEFSQQAARILQLSRSLVI